MITLRDYQSNAVERIRQSYRNGFKAPLLVLATGAGKTVCFTYIAATSSARAKRVLILVHRIELLRQTSKALQKFGVYHGLINPKYTPDLRAHVQVASVQTLVKRLDKIQPPDLIVIDEAHHASANTWRTIIERFPNARLLGVTATPCRGDGSGLGTDSGGFFDVMVQGPQVSDLIGMGYLVKPVIYAPKDKLDLTGILTKMGDYVKDQLAALVDKPKITGSAVEHYMKLCPGTPAVVFCVNVAHAQHVAAEFRAHGFRAYHADGTLDDEERARILNGLGNGQVQVVTSCDLISEGTDIPAIGCAILLRPTQSMGLYIQQVGRALRTSDGKSHAIILDHVGNVLTHGMPDEDRQWSLDGDMSRKKKKKQDAAPRVLQCEKCYAMHEPAPACPVCGHVYVNQARPAPQQVDGTLQQITAEHAAAIKRSKATEVARAKSLEDLEAIALARGYKPGWSKHIWQARQRKEMGKII